MKKLIVLSAVAISSLIFSYSASAQVRFNVNINIGNALPAWISYSNTPHSDYYYIPDADCYYSTNERMYIYRDGANWRRGAEMPGRFRGMDFRNRRIVGMRGEDMPFNHQQPNGNAFNNGNNHFNHQPDRQPQQRGGGDYRGNNGNGWGRRS
ncbi:hypothetical protein SAMN05421788_106302 [Filimonas lacunae]|uniref:YXWGXW repeat-containing protein n=1 Tax=Filimonas lacunae TaxID=477680 RepID=A0A173MF91_9BACT|nr:hypothetical protein [Filimonas lacunae]BAV06235.1 hypothetical protein FLA_2251 [Filimonas lacunae]SIT25391.1 hypothetical protein SAMN05421788_106302 [Filimonas lacunae]